MQIEIFSALTDLGIPQDTAGKAVEALETEMEKRVDFGVNALRSDIASMNAAFATMNATLTTEIAKLDAKMDAKINHMDSKIDHKVDSIRWMIGILVPAAATVVTAILAYLTHLK